MVGDCKNIEIMVIMLFNGFFLCQSTVRTRRVTVKIRLVLLIGAPVNVGIGAVDFVINVLVDRKRAKSRTRCCNCGRHEN